MATVEVTQADKDAAADLNHAIATDETLLKLCEGGPLPLVPARLLLPAFARHRLTSSQSKDAEIAQARAEIERLQADITRQMEIATEAVNDRERLQARVAELEAGFEKIEAEQHEPGCKFDFAPWVECPTCPSPRAIATQLLNKETAS